MMPPTRSTRVTPLRGYTIIEVVVAMSAGLLVSMATIALSKNATQFFQREARISAAQLGLTMAMNRLTLDIQRASLLSTPNIQADPNICKGTWTSAPGLSLLSGITITQAAASPFIAQPQPLAAPDQIIIGGSLDSADVYQVQNITVGAGGAPLLTIRAPTADPASYRALAALGAGETLMPKLTPVFYPATWPTNPPATSGRIGHLYLPDSNMNWYGIISTVVMNPATGGLQIQFAATPSIPQKPGSNCGLGIGDIGAGWLFSAISRVQYSIMSLAASPEQYGQVVLPPANAQQAAASGDSGRAELVRQELDATNTPMANTIELVAEYAVDMRFGITVSNLIQNNNYNPLVTTYPFANSNVYTVAAPIAAGGAGGGTPELIRAVQVRLSTRTRLPDRDTDLPAGPDGRRLRFLVDPTLQSPYARVRTNYANVALPNQGGFSLW